MKQVGAAKKGSMDDLPAVGGCGRTLADRRQRKAMISVLEAMRARFTKGAALLLVALVCGLFQNQAGLAGIGPWSLTGYLHQSRFSHTATLLPNGQVLAAGGYDGISVLSPELYGNPESNPLALPAILLLIDD